MKKTRLVYVLIPNDFEYSCQYFESKQDAMNFAKTYKGGAYVSDKPEEIEVKVLNRKQLKTASRGYRL